MKSLKILFTSTWVLFLSLTSSAQELKNTTTIRSLAQPESAVFLATEKVYFISNVSGQPAEKNGLGYITQIDENGQLIKDKWATGFNGPKGLAIHGKKLYVADIDVVKVLDVTNGNLLDTYDAVGATFLNDIEIDPQGTVYVSDTFGGNAIYRIKDGEISLWFKSEKLNYPNGLKIKDGNLYVASWGVVTDPETFGTDVPGKLMRVSLTTKEIEDVTGPLGNLDGLVSYADGFLVSDWIAGKLIKIGKDGTSEEILKLSPGSADLFINQQEQLLLVPQMLDNSLNFYKIK